MENCSSFFANKDCEYYPCHPGLKEFNCLFCYCPMNYAENYEKIIQFMKKKMPVFEEHVLEKQKSE